MFDIIGIDSPCVDLCINVEHFPKPDGFEPIKERSFQGGGKVSTGLVAASRLGATCAVIGCVGADSNGKFCIDDFHNHNIDTSHLASIEGGQTSFSVVISDKETSSRSIIYQEGPNMCLNSNDITDKFLQSAKYLYFSSVDSVTLEIIKRAKDLGLKTVMDADYYDSNLINIIPLVDIFIASEFVYSSLFTNDEYNTNVKSIYEKGPKIVVFTLGKNGCVGYGDNEFFKQEIFDVDVKDTVGAGDVFHGAYIAALVEGYSAKKSAQIASATSAVKCTRIGGRAGIPTFDVVTEFINTGHIDYSEIDQRVELYSK